MKPISRRTFLKLAAATGMSLSLGGCSLLTSFVQAPRSQPLCGKQDRLRTRSLITSSWDRAPEEDRSRRILALAGYTVLLLEAGGETENANYSVPAFHPLSTEDQDLQWNYFVRHYANDNSPEQRYQARQER